MIDFTCAAEHKMPAGGSRCDDQCPSCAGWYPEDESSPEEEARVVTTTFETYSGLYFDYLDPQPEQVYLGDIARALSLNCRFGGHGRFFYSVAEHAIGVRRLVVKWGHPELALAALHHDSHEAYLGDWPTPLKHAVSSTYLDNLQGLADVAIANTFDIDPTEFHHPIVKKADLEMLYREAATLKISKGVGEHWGREEAARPIGRAGLTPEAAEQNFIYWHKHEVEVASCLSD